jgi:hypothetical protein
MQQLYDENALLHAQLQTLQHMVRTQTFLDPRQAPLQHLLATAGQWGAAPECASSTHSPTVMAAWQRPASTPALTCLSFGPQGQPSPSLLGISPLQSSASPQRPLASPAPSASLLSAHKLRPESHEESQSQSGPQTASLRSASLPADVLHTKACRATTRIDRGQSAGHNMLNLIVDAIAMADDSADTDTSDNPGNKAVHCIKPIAAATNAQPSPRHKPSPSRARSKPSQAARPLLA